jgi:SOS-response transcriptional repressor LexA
VIVLGEAEDGTYASVAAFIANTTAGRGYPPSVREVAAHIGVSSSSTAQKVLNSMHRLGYVTSSPGRVRSITVTTLGMELAGDAVLHPDRAELRALLPAAMSYWSSEFFSASWVAGIDRDLPKMVTAVDMAARAVGAIPTSWDGESATSWRPYPDELD